MVKDARYILLALSLRFDNDWNKIYDELKSKKDVITDDEYLYASFKFDKNFICILDECYPERFKKMNKPPFILFYEGDLEALKFVDSYPNPYIFLYGHNHYNIPSNNVCYLTTDGKLSIAGRLKIWEKLNDDSCFLMPVRVCNSIVCFNRYSRTKGPKTKFGCITLPFALDYGCDVYFMPTKGPSFNNDLISEGALPLKNLKSINVL